MFKENILNFDNLSWHIRGILDRNKIVIAPTLVQPASGQVSSWRERVQLKKKRSPESTHQWDALKGYLHQAASNINDIRAPDRTPPLLPPRPPADKQVHLAKGLFLRSHKHCDATFCCSPLTWSSVRFVQLGTPAHGVVRQHEAFSHTAFLNFLFMEKKKVRQVDCDLLPLEFVLTYWSSSINKKGIMKRLQPSVLPLHPVVLTRQLVRRHYVAGKEPKLIFNWENMPISKPYIVLLTIKYWQLSQQNSVQPFLWFIPKMGILPQKGQKR